MCCLTQAWERLERAEHERERVLRDELIRQEKLEQMARRFDRKAAMRETWLIENQRLVAQVSHVTHKCIPLKPTCFIDLLHPANLSLGRRVHLKMDYTFCYIFRP